MWSDLTITSHWWQDMCWIHLFFLQMLLPILVHSLELELVQFTWMMWHALDQKLPWLTAHMILVLLTALTEKMPVSYVKVRKHSLCHKVIIQYNDLHLNDCTSIVYLLRFVVHRVQLYTHQKCSMFIRSKVLTAPPWQLLCVDNFEKLLCLSILFSVSRYCFLQPSKVYVTYKYTCVLIGGVSCRYQWGAGA